MTALITLISNLMSGKFFGELRLKFQGGKITHAEKHESLDVAKFQ